MPSKNFKFPLNFWKLVVFTAQAFNLAVFAAGVTQVLPGLLLVIVSCCYACSAVVVAVAAVRLGLSTAKAVPKQVDLKATTEVRYELYCEACQMYVNESTKHCSRCEECIEGFDHHCKWLNKCIGRDNYRRFVLLVLSFEWMTWVLLASEVLALVHFDWDAASQQELLVVVLALNLFMNTVIAGAVGYLIGFHVYLAFKGMTTYDFLMRRARVLPSADEMDNGPQDLVATTRKPNQQK